ncbi:unnamed protein product [Phytophthora lilii]|uniref:Unnamed protein product n=1 Tax=Phytophthora lilii TaxID=2077276 RepID=A0A9W6TEA9_9STRA|nr:unnamed protein product [Phytophthora lilii]
MASMSLEFILNETEVPSTSRTEKKKRKATSARQVKRKAALELASSTDDVDHENANEASAPDRFESPI